MRTHNVRRINCEVKKDTVIKQQLLHKSLSKKYTPLNPHR